MYNRALREGRSASRGNDLQEIPVISIVDDDESIRESMRGLIRSLGYVAATFASAEEFLESGRARDSSCLISDVQMPGMSGLELQNQLIVQGHCFPVIFITAYPEANVRARAIKAGALGFLSKPFGEEELITCLDEALNDHGS
jgi:FixJ family two-component response regulator